MFCFAALANMHTGTMYTNGTDAFPMQSFRNMQYMFVAYIYDLNAILVRAIPFRTDGTMIATFKDILANLNTRGYAPTLNVMDNKCSKAVEAHIRSNNMDIHLVPPHNHRVNAAERAIATFKEHFISALATVNKDCLLQLWDNFLPHVELTLKLLRFSQRDLTKSANKEVNGKFDYNKTLLAPVGIKGLVYEHPTIHASWAPHGTNAYYVGPALKHYRCLRFYMPGTQSYCVADTWRLYPTHCATPTISDTERTLIQATDTLTALGRTVPSSTREGIAQAQAIQQLRNILLPTLQQNVSPPPTPCTPSPREPRPRLAATPETRVPTTSPSPRVLRAVARNIPPPPMPNPTRTPTTSYDPTAPTNVRLVRPIHQRHTQSNNPFTILEDCAPDDEDEDIADNITIQASNQHGGALFSPFIRQMLEPPQHTGHTQPITSPTTRTIHDLQPTNKPTNVPTPRVLKSAQQQPPAQPPTKLPPQQVL
jgi:hypothetical protein